MTLRHLAVTTLWIDQRSYPRSWLLLAAVMLLAGCSTARTAAPAAPRVTDAPAPSVYTDAQTGAIVVDTIGELYCGTAPVENWCAQLFLTDGKPTVEVTGPSLFLTMQQRTPETLAMAACKALAFAHFDENAQPLSYRHVHVAYGAAGKFADCDVR